MNGEDEEAFMLDSCPLGKIGGMGLRFFLLFLLLGCASAWAGAGHRLEAEMVWQFGGSPLAFDTLALETKTGQRISVTRCDLLLSGAALQKDDGTWIAADKWAAYLGAREGRNRFVLAGIPKAKFTRLRFQVGVPPAVNHGDPAVYPAGHPLNPLVNGLHWGWQGGYVFAALEGLWRMPGGALAGYSYHLASDENLVTVDLPLALDLAEDHRLQVALDLEVVFGGLTMDENRLSSHSRPGDAIAADLRTNLAQAFHVVQLEPVEKLVETKAKDGQPKALVGPLAKPYRFEFLASFPRPELPADNPLTEEGVALGERLFHETRLSGNGTQSCASCHDPRSGFSDARPFSVGAEGKMGSRQAMPLFNLAWKSSFFWDGRTPTLRQQVLEPITNPLEMHASLPEAMARIASERSYGEAFERAFGSAEVNADRLARALEQYLLTLVTGHSKFDDAARGLAVLTAEEQRGAVLFNTEFDPARGIRGADCFHCHGGPLFQSATFANNGLDTVPADGGRGRMTKREGDVGKFAVPSLRNIALTAPYMHDGRFATLEEVVEHYDHGLQRSGTLDPNLAKHPNEGLRLSTEDKAALVAFLKTLTDERSVSSTARQVASQVAENEK